MKIVITGDVADIEIGPLQEAIQRVLQRGQGKGVHGIHVGSADRSGMRETLIVFNADNDGRHVHGQSFVVGQIQRYPGAELEYHS